MYETRNVRNNFFSKQLTDFTESDWTVRLVILLLLLLLLLLLFTASVV
jgi:hypothetical protein